MKQRKLPPLRAVLAFEATVRHMSFTEAARELNVTPSAVSQQIRSLEQYLGVALFARDPARGLTLTTAGQVCAPAMQPLFDSLGHVFEQVRTESERQTVTLLASPSLTATWLATRLARFRARFPDISLRIWVNQGLQMTQNPMEHDLAIYLGGGPFEDARGDLMMSDTVFPVCAPDLLGKHPIKNVDDLRGQHLIHDDTMIWSRESQNLGLPDWSAWLAFARAHDIDGSRGVHIQVSSNVLVAAAAGLGVALARSCIAEPYLTTGQLVQPLAIEYPRRFAYYLVCDPRALARLPVAQVHAWLLKEGDATMEIDRIGSASTEEREGTQLVVARAYFRSLPAVFWHFPRRRVPNGQHRSMLKSCRFKIRRSTSAHSAVYRATCLENVSSRTGKVGYLASSLATGRRLARMADSCIAPRAVRYAARACATTTRSKSARETGFSIRTCTLVRISILMSIRTHCNACRCRRFAPVLPEVLSAREVPN